MLLDVIQAVSKVAASEQETLATVADLIHSGRCGCVATPRGLRVIGRRRGT